MRADIERTIEAVTGARPTAAGAMGGGCIGDVYKVSLSDGDTVVAKVGEAGSGLQLEGFMLRYLAQHSALPVPTVLHADDDLLLMTYIDAQGRLDGRAQAHAADLVAALHAVTADKFGFACDTVIGGLHQPNTWEDDWLIFFRDHRLLYMGREALDAGRLPSNTLHKLERFSAHLDRWLPATESASLIHGDMWTGNVLSGQGRIVGFIDPAIYYADPEIELAFTTLFGTFDNAFFNRYREHRPLQPGFFEERIDIYNLYPLLVHVRLFGGGYVGSVERTLAKFGF